MITAKEAKIKTDEVRKEKKERYTKQASDFVENIVYVDIMSHIKSGVYYTRINCNYNSDVVDIVQQIVESKGYEVKKEILRTGVPALDISWE